MWFRRTPRIAGHQITRILEIRPNNAHEGGLKNKRNLCGQLVTEA